MSYTTAIFTVKFVSTVLKGTHWWFKKNFIVITTGDKQALLQTEKLIVQSAARRSGPSGVQVTESCVVSLDVQCQKVVLRSAGVLVSVSKETVWVNVCTVFLCVRPPCVIINNLLTPPHQRGNSCLRCQTRQCLLTAQRSSLPLAAPSPASCPSLCLTAPCQNGWVSLFCWWKRSSSGSVKVLNPSLAGSCPGRGRRPAQTTAAPPLWLRGDPPCGAAPPQRGISHPPHVGTRPEAPIRWEEEGQGERAVRRQWRL